MAGRSAILSVKILVDAAEASKGLDTASSKFGKFQSGLSKMTGPAAVALGGIAAFGKTAVDEASRVQQAYGALDSVFGKNADVVKGWAADAATSVGLSKGEYGEFASTIGAQLNNLTGDADLAMSGTKDLIGLGADLSATFGGSTADAVSALSSALRGEADPAERYGLALNQTAVNARLAEKGLDGLTGDALTAAKAQTVMELATEQAGGAVGQYGRELDTVAGAQQTASAQWKNAKSDLGEALLPAVAAVTSKLAEMAGWLSDNKTVVMGVVGAVAALASGILVLNGALKVWTALTKAWKAIQVAATAAQWLWNAALNANPVMLVVTAIAALVAAVVLLWNKNEGFRNFVLGMWEAIKTAAVAAWEWIKTAVMAVVSALTTAWQGFSSWITGIWNAIKAGAGAAWQWIQNIVQAVVGAVTAYINAYKAVVLAVWNAIKAGAGAVWNWIKSTVSSVVNAISGYVNTMRAGVAAAFNSIKSVASSVWNGIRSVVSSVMNGIRSAVNTVINGIKSAFNGVKSAVENVFRSISNVARSALNAIMGPVRSIQNAFNSVVSAVRNLIDWIGRIKMPSISLPKLPWQSSAPVPASSAYAARSTASARALAAPVPSRSGTLAGALSSGVLGGGGVTVININGGLDSADAIARRIERLLAGRSRRIGPVTVRGGV